MPNIDIFIHCYRYQHMEECNNNPYQKDHQQHQKYSLVLELKHFYRNKLIFCYNLNPYYSLPYRFQENLKGTSYYQLVEKDKNGIR